MTDATTGQDDGLRTAHQAFATDTHDRAAAARVWAADAHDRAAVAHEWAAGAHERAAEAHDDAADYFESHGRSGSAADRSDAAAAARGRARNALTAAKRPHVRVR